MNPWIPTAHSGCATTIPYFKRLTFSQRDRTSRLLGLIACFLCRRADTCEKKIYCSNATFRSQSGGVVGEICPI